MKNQASSHTLNQTFYGSEPIVDVLGSAAAAYSFNRVRQNYAGPAIRVRRSSDSAIRDIGFDIYGDFNSADYLSFIGLSSGFCVAMYDQSGGERDLVNLTALDQPQIVFIDGVYCLRPTGGDFLQNSSFVGSLGGSFTMHISWRAPGNPPSGFLSQVPAIDWAAGQNFFSPWWTTVQHGAFYSNAVATTSQAAWEDGQWRQMSLCYSGGNVSLYEYGTQIMEPIARVEPSWSRLTVGKNDFGNGDFYFNELILWRGSKEPQAIFKNYKKHYPSLLPEQTDKLFVFLGDSNTTTLYGGLGRTWTKIAGDASNIRRWFTVCQGGWTIQNVFDRRNNWTWYTSNVKKSSATLVVFLGTNDFAVDNISSAEALVKLKNLCRHAKNNGFTRTVVITPLPRFQSGTGTNITFEAKRQELSNAMVSDTSGDFDSVLDVRGLSIGVNGNQDTTTNYVADYIHLNATGQAILGNAVAGFLV